MIQVLAFFFQKASGPFNFNNCVYAYDALLHIMAYVSRFIELTYMNPVTFRV